LPCLPAFLSFFSLVAATLRRRLLRFPSLCPIYDADGRRVWKSAGGTTTDYMYDLSGKIFAEFGPGCTAGCWIAGAVYLNGQFFAEYYNNTTYFVHADHLGSSRLLTALDQSPCDNLDYLPFGEELSGGSCTNLRFTGQEHLRASPQVLQTKDLRNM
jgi:YD repeat-containing protein